MQILLERFPSKIVPVIFGTLLVSQPIPASAGSAIALSAVVDNCQTLTVDPDTRIKACSQLIHANIVSHGILAAFYFYRGIAYHSKGDEERAGQDIDKALQLKPDFPEALTLHGQLLDSAKNNGTAPGTSNATATGQSNSQPSAQ